MTNEISENDFMSFHDYGNWSVISNEIMVNTSMAYKIIAF